MRLIIPALITAFTLSGCASLTAKLPGQEHTSKATFPSLSGKALAERQASIDNDPVYLILAGELSGHYRDFDKAADFYSKAALNSGNPQLLQRAAQVALYAGRYQLAAKTASQWRQLEPDSAKALATLTIANIQLGDTKKADEALDHWLKDDSATRAHVFEELGQYLEKNVPKSGAVAYGDHLARRYPDDVDAQMLQARLGIRLDRPQTAIHAARQAVRLAPDNRSAHELLIVALSRSGKTKEVIAALDTARARFPKDQRFVSGLIEAHIHAGQTHKAGQLLQEALGHPIHDAHILRNYALFGLQIDRPVLTEKALDALRKLPGHRNEAELLLGRLAMQNGDTPKAADHFRKISPKSSNYVEARILLASALTQAGQLDAAVRSLDHGALPHTLDIGDLQRLTLAKAGLLQSSGKFQRALDVLTDAMSRWPDADDIQLQRALVLFKLNRPGQAKASLRAIINNDPENAPALNALGYTLVEENQDLDEAESLIGRALKQDPENAAYLDSYGWLQYRQGKLDAAYKTLNTAFNRNPDAEIGAHLGEVLWKLNRRDQARQIWTQSLGLNPDLNTLRKTIKRFAPDLLDQQKPGNKTP